MRVRKYRDTKSTLLEARIRKIKTVKQESKKDTTGLDTTEV